MVLDVSKVVECDVLVIGGAGAAVMSAVSALREGADVCLVSKGKVGRSGNTIMIGGGFGIDGRSAYEVCGETAANQNFTKEQLFETIVKSSFYLCDQELVRQYVDKGPYAVKECLDWARKAGQKFFFIPPASLWMTSGRSFGKAVKQGVLENPAIRVFEDTIICDLLTSSTGVCGALGISIYTGEIIKFKAGAVILATGGYQPFSLKNSISDMTGDGIAMAMRAGADVVDMEFLLFIPTALEPQYIKGSILPYLMTIPNYFPLYPTITDLDGKELAIAEEYRRIPPANKMNKILYAYFWGKGIFEKLDKYGNAMYFDFSKYTDEELLGSFEKMMANVAPWHAKNHYNGINLYEVYEFLLKNNKRFKVGLGNEYSMGGIVVDKDFASTVKGLYAAGEVTGGVFGAFRSADGLTEMLAHGWDAGKKAAEYAGKHGKQTDSNTADVLERLQRVLEPGEGISPYLVISQLEQVCDKGFNFFRTGELLQEAEEGINRLKEMLPKMKTAVAERRYNFEWISAVLAENLILCAEAGIHAANLRTESRGTHMRADYPVVNNREHLYRIIAKLEQGALIYRREKPNAPYLPLPEENVATIPDYILASVKEDSNHEG